MKIRKTFLLLLLVVIFLACGFFRDFIFLNVNEQSRVAYYHSPDSTLAPSLHFLTAYSYPQLYYFKWVLTFLFSLLFMGLSIVFVRLLFPGRKYLLRTLWAYAFLFLLSGVFFLGGYLAGHSEKGYLIARFLMGMAQGPLVLMVLIPAFKLLERMTGERSSS